MNMKSKNYLAIFIGVIAFLLVAYLAKGIVYQLMSEEVIVTVTGRDRINEASGKSLSSRYLIFTKGETFENTDTWLRGKFDSSDLQGQLIPHQTYKVKVIGYRIPLFSIYRNIVKVVPTDDSNTAPGTTVTSDGNIMVGDTLINGKLYRLAI